MDTTITTLEMCAGYGGIGLGLKNIFGERMRTLAYCELEGFAQANLISKMEAGLMDVAPLWNDLKTFPYESFHGLVDILIAGYPCQPFSAAGKRAGKEDPRHLWPWIADGIRLLRPRLCFFENVEGHISLGLREVIGELESMGYTVSWGIFSAREVGAPHQRKRVFILAVSNSLGGAAGLSRSLTWNEGFAGVADHGCNQVWPSRPGEAQHGWEPPRVVAGRKIMDDTQERCLRIDGENQRAPDGDGNTPDITSHGGGAGEGVANSVIVGRGRGSDGDAGGLRGEIQATGSCGSGGEEVLGNTILHGHAPTQISGGTSESKAERGLQESEGGSASVGNAEGSRPQALTSNRIRNAESDAQSTSAYADRRQTEPTMGRDADGPSDRLDYAELSVSCDNRTDELRLLGNGVVPATAERAFRTLLNELTT